MYAVDDITEFYCSCELDCGCSPGVGRRAFWIRPAALRGPALRRPATGRTGRGTGATSCGPWSALCTATSPLRRSWRAAFRPSPALAFPRHMFIKSRSLCKQKKTGKKPPWDGLRASKFDRNGYLKGSITAFHWTCTLELCKMVVNLVLLVMRFNLFCQPDWVSFDLTEFQHGFRSVPQFTWFPTISKRYFPGFYWVSVN